ncbi:MAG: DegT/DnrJ/EryC1/StrS family aminotransferase [Bacteroidales bacterium]|nr:DegT/DnrJ/EryC1/StrS family aminotransferase [Bacteroidales bacterium]
MIKYLDLKEINERYEPYLSKVILDVISSGRYLLGDELNKFESAFASYCGVTNCIGTANGLDALSIIFKALIANGDLKERDEIIVPANTFIATILSIINANLTPVLCEPDINTLNIDCNHLQSLITEKTKAIVAVHLYGNICNMDKICHIAQTNNLIIIEDCAQAHGASLNGRKCGTFGKASAFSFYPGKNLGALSDAGCITTDDSNLTSIFRAVLNYGMSEKYICSIKGCNSRLDEIQSAVLNYKLKFLDQETEKRRNIAEKYYSYIDNPSISMPQRMERENSVFHIFPILCTKRDQLKKYLFDNGIDTLIHYPVPPHKQKAFKEWNDISLPVTEKIHETILSIPLNPVLTESMTDKIIKVINSFDK